MLRALLMRIGLLKTLSRIGLSITVILMMASAASHASDAAIDGYSIAPIPSWVKMFGPGRVNKDSDTAGGERYLLLDRQSYDDGKVDAYHSHSIVEVVGQAGLSENSNLSISFGP